MMKIPVSRGFVYSSSPIFALFHRMERKFQRTECMFLRLERTFHGMEYKSFRVKKIFLRAKDSIRAAWDMVYSMPFQKII